MFYANDEIYSLCLCTLQEKQEIASKILRGPVADSTFVGQNG